MGFARMNDVFLTPIEKDNFANWVDRTTDNTLSSLILGRFWGFLASFIPDTVAPNVLSLAGLLCLIHAWYLVYQYIAVYPFGTSVLAILLIAAQLMFDGVDGVYFASTMVFSGFWFSEFFEFQCFEFPSFGSLSLASVSSPVLVFWVC